MAAANFLLVTTRFLSRHLGGPPEACGRSWIQAKSYYLLQEDERMFYGHGDDRLRCAETMADPHIRFVINSKLLFEHLTKGPEPLPNIADRGFWFEPAFPTFDRRMTSGKVSRKRQFFFYARPHNLRNLYCRGLETIAACLEEGILDPEEWDFHFAGRDLISVSLPHGVQPHLQQNLPWTDYVELIRRMDLGLSLMDTPHPSYPPLDLAASGAVVVTNRHGRKTSLCQYSENIVCVDPTVEALKAGIADGIKLALNETRRKQNWQTTGSLGTGRLPWSRC